MKNLDANKKLSKITFISTFGDTLSFYALLFLIYKATDSIAIAAFTGGVKSLGGACAYLCYPYLCKYNLRKLLFYSQALSFFLTLALLYEFFLTDSFSTAFVLFVFFLHSVCGSLFEAGRETYSKALEADASESLPLQAELLSYFYKAQFLAPIAALVLIKNLPLWLPLLLDSATFLIAALFITKLPQTNNSDFKETSANPFKPLKYLPKNKKLSHIFWIRAVGMWIPLGIFNYIIFKAVKDQFNLEVIDSVWIESAIGLGSMLSRNFLSDARFSKWIGLSKLSNISLLSCGLFALGLTRLGFISITNFKIMLVIVFIGGIFNGLNAFTSRTLRREHSTKSQFPEIISLETIIAKITDFSMQAICTLLLVRNIFDHTQIVLVSMISLFALSAWTYWGFTKAPKTN